MDNMLILAKTSFRFSFQSNFNPNQNFVRRVEAVSAQAKALFRTKAPVTQRSPSAANVSPPAADTSASTPYSSGPIGS